jgi:hypothetical protein
VLVTAIHAFRHESKAQMAGTSLLSDLIRGSGHEGGGIVAEPAAMIRPKAFVSWGHRGTLA